MKINRTIKEQSEGYTAVALGFFDGVHLAHQKIIQTTVKFRKTRRLIPTVFTFKIDTSIPNKRNVKYILSDESKIEIFKKHGVEQVYIPPFSELADISSTDFFYEVLLKKFKAKVIICGYDYTYGKGAKGSIDELMELCVQNNIELVVVNPMQADNVIVSSSLIRDFLVNGELKRANTLLGYNYFIKGVVCYGNQLGRTIGFPTANISLDENQIIPKYGVYRTIVYVDDRVFLGLTNVGVKPTIKGERSPIAETYILGLDENLYGKTLTLSFSSMIREEKKFDSIDELKKALEQDLENI